RPYHAPRKAQDPPEPGRHSAVSGQVALSVPPRPNRRTAPLPCATFPTPDKFSGPASLRRIPSQIHLEAGHMAAGIATAHVRRLAALGAFVVAVAAPSAASASPFDPTGVIRLVPHSQLGINANQS